MRHSANGDISIKDMNLCQIILIKVGGRVRSMVALQGPDTRGVSAKRTSPAATSLDARKILKVRVITRADRKSQVSQCLGFSSADS